MFYFSYFARVYIFFSFYRQKHQHNTIGYYTCLQSRGQIFQINILNIYSRIPYEWKQLLFIIIVNIIIIIIMVVITEISLGRPKVTEF